MPHTDAPTFDANTEAAIHDCLNGFDFEQLYAVMLVMNWTWLDAGVPSPEVARARAEALIRDCIAPARQGDDDRWSLATCGFTALVDGDTIELSFGWGSEATIEMYDGTKRSA